MARIYFSQNGPHGHGNGPMFCFRLQFPLSLEFPNGDSMEVEDRKEMKMALRAWKQANPDSAEHPSLQFPLSVTLEDGTVVEIQNQEELQALKDECAD